MSARQNVYDEEGEVQIEILSDNGALVLIECFKYDFKQYVDYYGSATMLGEPTWDDCDAQNWDYMLMGARDLYDYCEFMTDFAEQCGDMQACYAYASALAIFDDVQQTLGEVLDYANGDTPICKYDTETYGFWADLYNTTLYAGQCVELDEIGGGV